MKILHYRNDPRYKGCPVNWTPVEPRVEEQDGELGGYSYEKAGYEYAFMEETAPLSDGFHTFEELYEHRNTLLCAFLLETEAGKAWKSKLHHDSSSYDGWFIAGVTLPTGEITYHLPMDYWDLLQVDELEMAPEWDGHTPTDVVDRIQDYIVQEANSLYQTAWS